MKKSLNKFIKGYMEVLYALSSVFYIGFCLCVLVQVISRNFLPNAPSWTEELACSLRAMCCGYCFIP